MARISEISVFMSFFEPTNVGSQSQLEFFTLLKRWRRVSYWLILLSLHRRKPFFLLFPTWHLYIKQNILAASRNPFVFHCLLRPFNNLNLRVNSAKFPWRLKLQCHHPQTHFFFHWLLLLFFGQTKAMRQPIL